MPRRTIIPWTAGALFLAVVLLVSAWIPATASAGQTVVRVTYRFPPPVVESGKEHDRVHIPGLSSAGVPGAPRLPHRLARILLPPGEGGVTPAVVRLVVEHPDPVRVPGTFRPEPVAVERTPDEAASGPPEVEADPAIYGSSLRWPPQAWVELGVGRKHGRGILLLALHPLVTLPAAGELYRIESMTVEAVVETSAGGGEGADPRPDSPSGGGAATGTISAAALSDLAGLVDNPSWAGAPSWIRCVPPVDVVEETLPPPSPETIRAGSGDATGGGAAEDTVYAVVTSADLAPSFEPLAAARTAGGLPARIVTMEWIRSTYDGTRPDGGVDDATRLRNFVIDYYASHGLRYLLLAGDADGASSCSECEPPIVPARYFQTTELFANAIPSDMYFGCLDGTFDGDRDGIYGEPGDGEGGADVDFLFEVHVGRAPVDSRAEANRFVSKTLAYEGSSGLVLRDVLLVSEYLGFGGEYEWGGYLNDLIRWGSTAFLRTTGFENSPYVGFFNVAHLDDRASSGGGGWSTAELVDALERGVHLVNHIGHADSSSVMRLSSREIDALAGTSYFLGYSQSCYAGAFDNQMTDGSYGADSVVEHFISAPGGAAAFVANSRRGWVGSMSADGPSLRFNRRFWDAVLQLGELRWGSANDRSKEESVADISASERSRWCAYELNTFGDPSLTIKLANRKGSIALNRSWYDIGEGAQITLIDADLNASPDTIDEGTVIVRASGTGDEETIRLHELGPASGVFTAVIAILQGARAADGLLQVSPPDVLSVRYDDADDGLGRPATVTVTADVTGPLAVASDCPAEGSLGVPFSSRIEATGGLPPYRFSSEEGYIEELGDPRFEGLGIRQNWQMDEGHWTYALPFEFPFYGSYTTSVIVSSNGYIDLEPGGETDWDNSVYRLLSRKRIAPYWADLVTGDGGDIYINEKAGSVTFRWRATGYHTHGFVNFEAELFEDGTIRFGYGAGNEGVSPTIGISAGDATSYVVSSLNGSYELANAPSVRFRSTRLHDGLSVDPLTGVISGFPLEAGTLNVSLRAEDSRGKIARKVCSLTIRPDGIFIESPRAGDLWLRGSEQTIRWQWFGSAGSHVRLDYNTDGSTTSFPLVIAASVNLSSRAHVWRLPDVAAPAARVRVRSVEKPGIQTYSEPFSIVGPTILLQAPNGGETWITGGAAEVTWSSVGNTGSRVRIRYSTDGSSTAFPNILAPDVPNTGRYGLIVPGTPSETCRLCVENLADPTVRAVSREAFAIRRPSIALTYPNGGECLRAGDDVTVTWISNGGTGAQVYLEFNIDGSTDSFPYSVSDDPLPNSGSATWTVPELPLQTVRLRIRASGFTYTDVSDGSFSVSPRCTTRIVLWVPYISADEEQVLVTQQALENQGEDLEVFQSTATTPALLEAELSDKDALIVVRQKQSTGLDLSALGEMLAPVLRDFLARGGSVVACPQISESEVLIRALDLFQFDAVREGIRLCEVVDPADPIMAGVHPNFSGPFRTVSYQLQGAGVRTLATGEGDVVVAARDHGFGRVAFLGFDYYSTNDTASRILGNSVRLPVVAAGIRILSPDQGGVYFVGETVSIRWISRGEARGRVAIAYNDTGSDTEFPLPIAEVSPSGADGSFDWTAPPVPADRPYLKARLRIQSVDAPQHQDVLADGILIILPLEVATSTLPAAGVRSPYRAVVQAKGGIPPYEFQLSGLPGGLIQRALDETSVEIIGVPQDLCEACEIEVRVQDRAGFSAERLLVLSIQERGIRLTAPRGGELWLRGSSREVTWSVQGDVGATVSLSFNTDGSLVDFPFSIAEGVPVDLPYAWLLPLLVAPTCRLKVQSDALPEFYSTSDETFSIVGPTIRLEAPDGEECWEPGKQKAILWRSASGPGESVRIDYNTDGSTTEFPLVIAEAAPDTGHYVWLVEDTPSDSCRVRVSLVGDPSASDVSAQPFAIRPDCRLSGLLWSPFLSQAQVRAVITGVILERDPDFEIGSVVGRDVGQVSASIANRDVLIVLMRGVDASECEALGVEASPLLTQFVEAGGVVLLCGPNAEGAQFLRGLGLASSVTLTTPGALLPCDVVSYLHPIVREIPLEFVASPTISTLEISDGGWESLVETSGAPLILSRDQGWGRWVIFGLDLRVADPVSANLLVNALRMRVAVPGLRLLSPIPGTLYFPGDDVPVRWAARGEQEGTVTISYNTDGSTEAFPLVAAHATGGRAGGEFLWQAPEPSPGRDHFSCRMQVAWAQEPALPASSEGVFHVVRDPLSVETASLAGGYQNAEYLCEVRAAGGVKPYAFDAVGLHAGLYLVASEPESSVATIQGVPLETGTDQPVTIRVRDALGLETERAYSLDIIPSEIEILAPVGGEFLLSGSLFEIRWQVHGYAGETFRIEYGLDGSMQDFPFVAASAVQAAGSFLWQVPDVESVAVRLRIVSNEFGSIAAVSGRAFSIAPPGVTCLYPNGAERLETGTRRTLRWRSLGNPGATVRIEMCTDGSGEHFPFTIAEGAPDTGQLEWKVPELQSERCLIRVSFPEEPEMQDASDSMFAISSYAPVRALVWVPHAGFDDAEVRGPIAAATLFEHDLDWMLSKAVKVLDLQAELHGKETFIMVQQRNVEANYRALGKAFAPVLKEFVEEGGTLVVLKQVGAAREFLPSTGLMSPVERGGDWNLSCRVSAPDHPVMNQVPPEFHPDSATAWYEIPGDSVTVYATDAAGHPVVAGREVGDGRVLLIGFDYRDYNESTARILANAVRYIEPEARPRFVRGDANSSGKVDIGDAIFILNYLFKGGPEPTCLDAADVDDSSHAAQYRPPIDIGDAMRLLQWLLLGGPAPASPSPRTIRLSPSDCGVDPQYRDGLSCLDYWLCAPR